MGTIEYCFFEVVEGPWPTINNSPRFMIYWFLTWGYNTSKAWASLPITLVIETSTFRRRVISLTLIFNLKLSFHHDKSLPITLTYLQRYELFFKLIAFWTNFFFFLYLRSQTHLYNSKIGTTSKSISKSCKMIIFLVHKCHSSIAQVHLTMAQERLLWFNNLSGA